MIDSNIGALIPYITPLTDQLPATLGQKAEADSLAVTLSTEDIAVLNSIATGGSKTGTITQAKKTVGITAVRATVSGGAPNVARKKLYIKPTIGNTGAIYLGNSSVTVADGLQIVGPDRLEFEADASDYYLISDIAGQSVEILEVV